MVEAGLQEDCCDLNYSMSSQRHLAGSNTRVATAGSLALGRHNSFQVRSGSGIETEDPLWGAEEA